MLEEQKKEDKMGFQMPSYGKQATDNEDYNDDFEEEIDEELPEDNYNDDDGFGGGSGKHGAGQSDVGITVSQSLGVDPSVDSLALEDYDHIEPVERLG
jgi:hypothetical protein